MTAHKSLVTLAMSIGALIVVTLLPFAASFFLTKRLVEIYVRAGRLDYPNHRSSHQNPTPRGGGLAFVVVIVVSMALALAAGLVSLPHFLAVALGGGLVAVVGYADDRGHLSVATRLIFHFAGAGIVLWLVGPLQPIDFFFWTVDIGWLSFIAALLFLVWSINLTNFMDGIDGLAATQGVTISLTTAATFFLVGAAGEVILPSMLFAFSLFGFLIFNLPPARIFMGDVGSGFLGVLFGYMVVSAGALSPSAFWAIVIAYAVFVADATFTLLRRSISGLRPYEAHRDHAYQKLVRRFGSHRLVTAGVAIINLLWLFPLAIVAALGWLDGATLAVIAYLPIVAIVCLSGAGKGDRANVKS